MLGPLVVAMAIQQVALPTKLVPVYLLVSSSLLLIEQPVRHLLLEVASNRSCVNLCMVSGGYCPGDIVRGILSRGYCPGDIVRGILSRGYCPGDIDCWNMFWGLLFR